MTCFRPLSVLFSVCFFLASAGLGSLSGQVVVKADVNKPDFDALPSPQVNTGGVDKRFKPKDWLEIEVEFELDARDPQGDTPDFVDQIEVQYYIAVENGKRSRTSPAKNFLLERAITHVNIPVGEKVFSSIYLSPSTVKRITGQDRAGKNVIKEVAVIFRHQGRPVGGTRGDVKKNLVNPNGWWTKLGGNELMRSEKFPLLSKDETPFALFWWDRYAEPKTETRR